MEIKIHEAMELVHQYGRNTTMGDFLRNIQGDKIHKCPKCNGTGSIEIESGPENQKTTIMCTLCDGEGYTEKQYRPHIVQKGWKTEDGTLIVEDEYSEGNQENDSDAYRNGVCQCIYELAKELGVIASDLRAEYRNGAMSLDDICALLTERIQDHYQ